MLKKIGFKSERRLILSHAIGWFLFILYEVLFVITLTGKKSSFIDYASHYAINALLVYVTAHFILNYFSKAKSRLFLLIPLLIGELAIYTLLMVGLGLLLEFLTDKTFNPNRITYIGYVWRGIYFMGFSTGYWFFIRASRHRKSIADLETKQLKGALEKQVLEKNLIASENAYLQSQINPHFLFNTLNFLYNTVNEVSDKAAKTVLLLSEVMAYALTELPEDNKVRLEDEIEHIRNLIELNQLRHENLLNINLGVTGDPGTYRIIPLTLLTLVENVFKYGNLKNPDFPAFITISVEKTLTVRISNKKRLSKYPHSHGIGLKNVRQRLETFYKGQYELVINDQPEHYLLTLKIEL
jgi:hypothetical protein